ncbi:hypothetical protein PhaeoP83_01676 [Phaeobacter inhibens]|uniref:Arc-like DNA binding domain-containing protein n=1 Tax=Phaeobacter inhibens TaxID=221822 RepID=A0ABN5GP50_9RHOB|nr:hypothetical protein PhaeoP83_01676 [Phaeobacter inhibens]AUQ94506.1 hypothetical protein PhaeoP66_01724 [Phaeobacter inhibens]AUR19755.1 hypothetical protein PhaeoP80_01676 [Phaeobacter inhibens]
MNNVKRVRWTAQLPVDVDRYLSEEAQKNCTSKNAELIRAVRNAREVAENAAA